MNLFRCPIVTEAHGRKNPNDYWHAYSYDELINHNKVSLDIFWLRDESLEDSDNLPDPDVLAQEIVNALEAALEQLRAIANEFQGHNTNFLEWNGGKRK